MYFSLRFIRSITAFLMFAIMTLPFAPLAMACAPAPRQDTQVSVTEESAVIVWDAGSKTEHFIRRATFNTTSPDFGFMVPTPTTPQLAEASDDAFLHLERLTQPERREEVLKGFNFTPLIFYVLMLFMVGSSAPDERARAGQPEVRVLNRQRVAGFDAVVLEANDPATLVKWLKTNGYAARPELTAWFAPYIAAGWKITAFKIAAQDNAKQVASAAVRMSFQTERPFFPYREPEQKPELLPEDKAYLRTMHERGRSKEEIEQYRQQRLKSIATQYRHLRVLMLSTERMDGVVGGAGAASAVTWPGKTTWTAPIAEGERSTLAKELALSANQLPAQMWMTAFSDYSSPRPGTDDLYFSRAADQSRIVPPPIITTRDERLPLPLDLLILFLSVIGIILVVILGGGILGLRWIRARRNAKESVVRV